MQTRVFALCWSFALWEGNVPSEKAKTASYSNHMVQPPIQLHLSGLLKSPLHTACTGTALIAIEAIAYDAKEHITRYAGSRSNRTLRRDF